MEHAQTPSHAGLPVRPLPDGSDIRKMSPSDVPQVANALALSFYDDPLWTWLYPEDSDRLDRLERGFQLYLRRVWLPQDECYAIDRLTGGALWMPPGKWHLSVLRQLWLMPATIAVTGRHLPKLLRLINRMEAKHPHESHHYLAVLGVEPEWQGKGFGTALMRPVLERCDREGLPAYLEASTPRSRALYERNGFETVEELTVSDSPPLWRMWREPRR